ncbi:MAG TPA: 16S rRNA methyltransferase, partial [Thermoplasmata archaeon]|nr:16S rRNA methyltransferase [Thermoplasmata archaeon]
MLTLVLADSELELVPPSIAGHPAIRTSARKRGRSPTSILLDSSLHHPALKGVPDGERRGRPDLVHGFVLLCLDSIVNQEGRLTTIVHTRHDDVLRFAPQTRIPRNYARFVGL